jgi:hypothetical protein
LVAETALRKRREVARRFSPKTRVARPVLPGYAFGLVYPFAFAAAAARGDFYREVLMVRWFLALCGVIYGLGMAAAQAELLKMAVFLPPKSVGGSRVLTPISNEIKKESGGKLIVKPFYGGQLGRSPAIQYKLVTDGVADMA